MAVSLYHIIECPNCHAIHQKEVIIGGFPSYGWSDLLVVGRNDTPLENLKISQCTHCSHFFWMRSEHTLGNLEHLSPLEWHEAPLASTTFSFETWKQLVEMQLFENETEEIYVRLCAWQHYNHFFRYTPDFEPESILVAFNEANMLRLYQILPNTPPENWALKAEIQRHLESWEVCMQICRKMEKKLESNHYLRVFFRKIRKAAQAQYSKVFQFFT